MPLRVRRVRIPVSRFSQLLKNTACLQKPQVFSGFLCVNRPWFWAAPICTLSCNSVQTCTNPCELYGTIRGTSAPLTAPFFGQFWGSTGWRNRCMAGSGRGGWLTFALENYLWPRRRLRAPALAVAQRAAIRSGGSANSGFSCCSPLHAEFRCSCETREIQPRTL